MRLLVLAALAGCGLDVGPAGPWVPIDEARPPLTVESVKPPPQTQAFPAPSTIRVVTYNIDEEEPDVAPADLAATITGDPDLAGAGVYLFQEAEAYPGEPTSRVAAIAQQLGVGYYYVPGNTRGPGHTHGLAILSPYPIENVEKQDLPMAGPARRIAVSADIIVGARSLHVINVHLEMRANAATRIAQLRPAVIDATSPVLIGGDFNMSWLQWVAPNVPVLSSNSATDQSASIDAYMTALGFDTPTAKSGPTAWADGFGAREDAFYTRGLAVTFHGVRRIGPSDHTPMWIDVQLP